MSSVDISEPQGAAPRGPSSGAGGLSDALNPILVREVQQAVKGRVLQLTIFIALVASVVIASSVASDAAGLAAGRGAFEAGLATLVPLLLFVIPMQAYSSMRAELKGGVVEQLLLSRLGPGRVVSGKLQAAMVQFLLYVSLLSPLLATSYLLRGVDLLTISVSLFFALIACVTVTVFAISSAAQAVVPALQPIANLGMAFGLGLTTLGVTGAVLSGGYSEAMSSMLRSREVWTVVSGATLGSVITITLSWLIARSYLLHTFEDKSSGFRIFLWTSPVLVYGWMLGFVESRDWHDAFPLLTFGLLLAAIIFGVFMATEQRDLSPRVRNHAPTGRMSLIVAVPLLPGRDRGMLCFTMFAALLFGLAATFWPSPTESTYDVADFVYRLGLTTLAYGFVYLLIGRWLRAWFPETVKGSQAARVALPLFLFFCIVVPLLIDGFSGGRVSGWHLGHVLNPFWTMERFCLGMNPARWEAAEPFVITSLAVGALAQVPIWVRGVREVARAARARRSA